MPERKLTMEALRGLSEVALDARLSYTSGGVMVDERYYETVLWLADQTVKIGTDLAHALGSLVEIASAGCYTDQTLAQAALDLIYATAETGPSATREVRDPETGVVGPE